MSSHRVPSKVIAEQSSREEEPVRRLLDHLASGGSLHDESWQGWQITRIAGGRNNLLYRATGPQADLAIKFTIPDERSRASREYQSLLALRQAGLSVAPEAILLDRASYAQPVVVQTWLEGEVSVRPPNTVTEWQCLLQHLAAIHTVTPDKTRVKLRQATINASNAEEGKQRVREQMAHVARQARPASLRALLRRFETCRFPQWPRAPVTLCRLDNNISNYIRRPGLWASVDWEYSGWGDPAFDVANLITHVAYVEVPTSRWQWVADIYCGLVKDATAPLRIQVYCQILVMWWIARLTRYLYELPQGLDERLATWSAGWQADLEAKAEHYLGLAQSIYS
jgi:aminoglycoside phosphotransferase (APT) family kinase protein